MIGIQGENALEEVTKSPPDTALDSNSTNSVENGVITQALANLLIKRTLTKTSISVSASSVADVTFDVAYNDYTPIGIVGTRIGDGGASSLVSSQLYGGTNVATVRVRNNGTSAVTIGDVNIDVLYVKNIA